MKTIYWQRHNVPRFILIFYCLFVLGSLFIVEHFKKIAPQPYYTEKYQAISVAYQAMTLLKDTREAKGIPISPKLDPAGTGLIGEQLTPITTDHGVLAIKQTTTNPNIAALFVLWMKEANLKPGDTIALGMTGSFPGLDIAALSAIKALHLKPLLILSAGASQYGANIPGFTWIDMYHALQTQGIFHYEPLAVSLGGSRDRAYGMSEEGRALLTDTIKGYHYNFLNSESTIDGINKRMQLYDHAAAGAPIKAYVNIGGGMASIGLKQKSNAAVIPTAHPHVLRSGVITALPISLVFTDSISVRFLKRGVPVINAHNIHHLLVDTYQFPVAPTRIQSLGEGSIFYLKEYNPWLALSALVLDVLVFMGIVCISRKYVIRYKPGK